MSVSRFRRILAGVLAVSVVLVMADFPTLAAESALFRGRVLGGDGVSPRSGVVVTLVDRESQKTFDSAPADDRGYFKIDSAPAGTYRLVARASEGAFLASDALTLKAGANKPVALALKANAAAGTSTGGSSSGSLEPWMKWVIVGGIVVGALIVADAVTGKEEPASPM